MTKSMVPLARRGLYVGCNHTPTMKELPYYSLFFSENQNQASQRHPIVVSQRPMPPARKYVCELEEDGSTYTRVDPQPSAFPVSRLSTFQISNFNSLFHLPFTSAGTSG